MLKTGRAEKFSKIIDFNNSIMKMTEWQKQKG